MATGIPLLDKVGNCANLRFVGPQDLLRFVGLCGHRPVGPIGVEYFIFVIYIYIGLSSPPADADAFIDWGLYWFDHL